MPDGTLDPASLTQISRTGLSPSTVWLPSHFCYLCSCVMQSSTPQVLLPMVWPLSISLAATLEIDVSFSSSAYLDVSVQRVPFVWLWIHHTMTAYCTAGFPHSEICGSKAICASPQLIAACHVLLRLLMPRHSPCALVHLTVLLESYEFFSSFTLNITEKLRFRIVQFSRYTSQLPLLLTFRASLKAHRYGVAPSS